MARALTRVMRRRPGALVASGLMAVLIWALAALLWGRVAGIAVGVAAFALFVTGTPWTPLLAAKRRCEALAPPQAPLTSRLLDDGTIELITVAGVSRVRPAGLKRVTVRGGLLVIESVVGTVMVLPSGLWDESWRARLESLRGAPVIEPTPPEPGPTYAQQTTARTLTGRADQRLWLVAFAVIAVLAAVTVAVLKMIAGARAAESALAVLPLLLCGAWLFGLSWTVHTSIGPRIGRTRRVTFGATLLHIDDPFGGGSWPYVDLTVTRHHKGLVWLRAKGTALVLLVLSDELAPERELMPRLPQR